MGAAGTRTRPSWAAEHSPPRQNPSSISSPSFSGKPSSPSAPHAFCNFIFLPRQVAGPSLAAFCVLSFVWTRGSEAARTSFSLPPRPILPLGSKRPQLRSEARLPRGLKLWGRSGFLLRASQEHYGRARSRLRPPAPASPVRSWDWRRPRGRERERGGTRPPVRAQTAAAAALAAMAERRAFAQKISR